MSPTSIFPIASLKALASIRAPGFMEALEQEATPVFTAKKGRLLGYDIPKEVQRSLAVRFPLSGNYRAVDVAQVREEASSELRGEVPPVTPAVALLRATAQAKLDAFQDLIEQLTGKKPCEFEGCEERRRALEKELKSLSADCEDCEKNAVHSKHINQLRIDLLDKKIKQSAPTQDDTDH